MSHAAFAAGKNLQYFSSKDVPDTILQIKRIYKPYKYMPTTNKQLPFKRKTTAKHVLTCGLKFEERRGYTTYPAFLFNTPSTQFTIEHLTRKYLNHEMERSDADGRTTAARPMDIYEKW